MPANRIGARGRRNHSESATLLAQDEGVAETKTSEQRLLDRQAFDRITLNAESGGDVIETLLLELPNRRVPNPRPTQGELQLRRLSEPSVLYKLPWISIARIEFFEQILLQEAVRLARARQLDESYEYLAFLHQNYPGLNGLNQATAQYLRQDAQIAYGAKDYEATLTVLHSLYDLDPNQRGLRSMVETVTNRIIEKHLADRDFGAARSVLEMLTGGFPALKATNIESWEDKFQRGAQRQLEAARAAIEREQYSEARRAVRRALAILPNANGAVDLMDEISRLSPQTLVAVDQLAKSTNSPLDLSSTRIAQLTEPNLITLTGFSAEGGSYACPWGTLVGDDSGLLLKLDLNQAARQHGITAEAVALQLLQRADQGQATARADFEELFDAVEIESGEQVKIHWQHPHVRPEALLSVPLRDLTASDSPPGAYQLSVDPELPDLVTFRRPKEQTVSSQPETIIEKYYDNDEFAIAQLASGEIDIIARVPPWQIARLEQTPGVVVAPYRLATVHALTLNYDKPLLGRREFRRALCYGIDRAEILNSILLGGERRAGYRVLSAPIPAGVTVTDPVGYAYNQARQPRAYEPRLAAVLAAVARNSLAKLNAKKEQAAGATVESSEETPTATDSDEGESAESPDSKAEPLILAHPPSPIATTVCQTIKLQLGAIGIPVTLQELDFTEGDSAVEYDLRYAELAIWEPIVDLRRLLGPDGIAGTCSSSMSLALGDVAQAQNWKEVRSRLREVHEIAFNDLPVIPLWQTIDYYAYRESLNGIGTTPVTLYQNVEQWSRSAGGGSH